MGSHFPVTRATSEDDLYFRGIPLGRPIESDTGPESHRPQDFRDPLVVIAIAGRIEANQLRIAFLVDVEEGLHVEPFHARRRRHRGDEEISHRGRIVFARTTTGARADTAAASSSLA